MAAGNGPLSGVRVVVTRPQHQAQELLARLRILGAITRCIPATRITGPLSWTSFDQALTGQQDYDWVIFTSQNGVQQVLRHLEARGQAWPFRARIAAVGPETARGLDDAGYRVDLIPHVANSVAIAETLKSRQTDFNESRILLLRGQLADDKLALALQEVGAMVDACVVYQTLEEQRASPKLGAIIKTQQVDWVTITSGSAIQSLTRLPQTTTSLHQVRIASIGPQTSHAIRKTGLTVSAEAETPRAEALVSALLSAQMALQSRQ